LNEAELIRRCQTGDSEAFCVLIEQYRKVLFGTAFLMTRDHGLAEDMVQEALFRIWRGLPSFRPGGSFKAWLVRILVNEVKQLYRKRRVQTAPLGEATALSGNPDEPVEAMLREEERHQLRQGLERLQEEHREVLILRYYADLTVPEIAKALGCREGTVKSRLHRALNRLGDVLTAGEWQSRLGQEG
jgi:RNA polymerase sigma-70 factor (ECF subfamily)